MNTVLAGVLLQLSALALFVAMDTLLKLLTLSFAVPQLMWARFLFSFIAVTIAMRVITGSLPWRSRAPGLQTIRSLLLAACNFMFSSALVHIPLADATAVGFASPLFTLALAAVWLGERIGPWRWFGMALGFAGVVILLRPPFLLPGNRLIGP